METKIMEIAQRIKGLREILEMSREQVAKALDISLEEYVDLEEGRSDFSFTFLYGCANLFGVDIVELMSGEPPKLSRYTVVRSGKGLPIKRRAGFSYLHLAYRFKDKISEPFLVTAPYSEEEQDQPLKMSRHAGQEFDYILKGSLKMEIDGHIEVLSEGDSIYYDSGSPHGMIATGGTDCLILAVVMIDPNNSEGE